jgi:hypothetical protein
MGRGVAGRGHCACSWLLFRSERQMAVWVAWPTNRDEYLNCKKKLNPDAR